MGLWSFSKFFRLGAGIGTAVLLVDATEEVSLWLTCRQKVQNAANANEELKAELGQVLTPCAYWDSSLRTTHRGNVLHCTIPLRGERGTSDVQIKLVKSQNTSILSAKFLDDLLGKRDYCFPGENLVYNHLGPGEWKVLVHYAVISGAGALPKHFNLEEAPPKAAQSESGKPAAGSPAEALWTRAAWLASSGVLGGFLSAFARGSGSRTLSCEENGEDCGCDAAEASPPPSDRATAKWRVFTDRGRELHTQGRIEEARTFFERAVEEAEKGFGSEDEHLAASYQNLAELLRINREFEDAETLYLKAIAMLELRSKKRGAKGSQFEGNNFISEPVRRKALATTVDRLCGLYLQMRPKKLEEARECYRKALRLKLEAFGRDHIEVANTLASAAQVSRLDGHSQQAIDLLGQSLDCLLKNQGNEDESGRTVLNDSLMKVLRGRSLQMASLLLKQEGGPGNIQQAEGVLRRYIKLAIQGKDLDTEEGSAEDDVLGQDPQVCNLMCQSLVASGEEEKCAQAAKFLETSRASILGAGQGSRRKESLQHDLVVCAVGRQLAEAHLCVAAGPSAADGGRRAGILDKVETLGLGELEKRVERWWSDLQTKRGVEVLQTKRLLPPVTMEFLLHLRLSARYASERGTMGAHRREEIQKKVRMILEAAQGMPEASRKEVDALARKVLASL